MNELAPRHYRDLRRTLLWIRNRIIGAAKEAEGAVEKTIDQVTGDAKLQADGSANIAEGKVQNAIGGLGDAV